MRLASHQLAHGLVSLDKLPNGHRFCRVLRNDAAKDADLLMDHARHVLERTTGHAKVLPAGNYPAGPYQMLVGFVSRHGVNIAERAGLVNAAAMLIRALIIAGFLGVVLSVALALLPIVGG